MVVCQYRRQRQVINNRLRKKNRLLYPSHIMHEMGKEMRDTEIDNGSRSLPSINVNRSRFMMYVLIAIKVVSICYFMFRIFK